MDILKIIQTDMTVLKKELSDFKGEITTELSDFKGETNTKLEKITTELSDFKGETNTKLEKITTELSDFKGEITKELSDFKGETNNKLEKITTELSDFKGETNTKLEKITTELSDFKGEITKELSDFKGEFKEFKGETAKNMKEQKSLLDYQFEITARLNITHSFNIKFSKLYAFKNMNEFTQYFYSIVDQNLINKMFQNSDSRYQSMSELIYSKIYIKLVGLFKKMILIPKYSELLDLYKHNASDQNPDFKFWSVFNFLKLQKNKKFSDKCEINIGGGVTLNEQTKEIKISLGEIKFQLNDNSDEKAIQQVYNPINLLSTIIEFALNDFTIKREAIIFFGRNKKNYTPKEGYSSKYNMFLIYHMITSNGLTK
jgi:iron-sulfur cluster repair protein YtfE (RIC family)